MIYIVISIVVVLIIFLILFFCFKVYKNKEKYKDTERKKHDKSSIVISKNEKLKKAKINQNINAINNGSYSENIVSNYFYDLLCKYYKNSEFKIYTSIIIETKLKKTTEIDTLVICKKGIFVIETKNWNGDITGDNNSEHFQIRNYYGTTKEKNPVIQNDNHILLVEKILEERGINWDKLIVSYIIFSNDNVNITNIDSDSCFKLYEKKIEEEIDSMDECINTTKLYQLINIFDYFFNNQRSLERKQQENIDRYANN